MPTITRMKSQLVPQLGSFLLLLGLSPILTTANTHTDSYADMIESAEFESIYVDVQYPDTSTNSTSDQFTSLDDKAEYLYRQALSLLSFDNDGSDSFLSSTSPNDDDNSVTIYIPMDQDEELDRQDYSDAYDSLPMNTKTAYNLLNSTSYEMGHAGSHFLLAQFHMFGNHSIPSNLTLALDHYEHFVELAPKKDTDNLATAYFHLATLYSTGGNGVFEVDQAMAALYYQLAFQSADPSEELGIGVQAAMVLAYRHYQGIATNVNYPKALFYYQYAANKLHHYHEKHSPIGGMDLDSYSLRIADFQGGVYGSGVGDMRSSLHRSSSRYDRLLTNSAASGLNILGEPDSDDTLFNELYVNVLIYYEGSYLKPRNYAKAYRYAKHAMDSGLNQLASLGGLDKRYVSKCIYVLGRMYLRGEGVQEDHQEAKRLFELSLEVFPFGDTFNDLGLLHEFTSQSEDLKNITLAIELYHNASILKTASGNYNYGRSLLSSPSQIKHQKPIEIIAKAADHLDLQAVYLHSQLLNTYHDLAKGQDITLLQIRDLKYYVESFDPVVCPYLRFAFFELLSGNYHTAVTAYSIASEQGFESAQASLGYLLYQLPTIGDPDPPKLTESRQLSAIAALTRSSAQSNLDSLLYLGDIYTLREEHDKAFICYESASVRGSSQGSFNLGWVYEYGIGSVERDFHLSKRYYDLALLGSGAKKIGSDSGMGSYLPVQLALLRLRVKRFWGNLMGIKDYGFTEQQDDKGGNSGRRSWSDWVSLYRRVHNGGNAVTEPETVVNTPNKTIKQSAEDDSRSIISEILDSLTPSYEDIALLLFLLVAFGLFFIVHWNQQRQLRERRGQNDNGDEDQQQRQIFEFNFQVVAI